MMHNISSPDIRCGGSKLQDNDRMLNPIAGMWIDETWRRHLHRLFKNFNDLKNRQLLFDFTICVGTKELRAHKIVLAASSDYFRGMLAHGDTKEVVAGKVHLQNLDALAVEAIINYMYTFEIDLNEENIEQILLSASILQVQVIEDLCVLFIRERINASNCLGVALLSDRCNLVELGDIAWTYCYKNFKQVVNEREFDLLDEIVLTRLISEDKLNIDDETQVFDAVIKWMRADEAQRRPKLYEFMQHVRFATMKPVTLVNLATMDLIQDSFECRDLIDKAKNYLLLRDHPELKEEHIGKIMTKPRLSLHRIYVVGGWTDEYRSIASAEIYDLKTNHWTEIPPMTQARCGVGLAALGGSIFAVGGHDGKGYLNTVERYDVKLCKWFKDVAHMKYKRSSVGVVALGGYIYAIGGQGWDAMSLDKVERYNPSIDSWEECAPMDTKRLGLGVAIYKGCIYVMGGSDRDGLIYNTVERYDPKTNSWTEVAPMGSARKHLGSCTCQGLIYAVGGRNLLKGELDSAEVYDPIKDEWSDIPAMQIKRCGMGLVEVSGLVYAIGGQNRDVRLDKVEAYDPQQKNWTWKSSMKHSRLGGGTTVYPPILE